jgi:PAS domain S-box-containing protein
VLVSVLDSLNKAMSLVKSQYNAVRESEARYRTLLEKSKRAEEALRESEERFRNMFERHQAVMLLIDPESGIIVDANAAASRFYGYPPERLRAMRIQDLNQLKPGDVAAERKLAVEEKRNYFIFPHRLADGRDRWVEVYSTPFETQGRSLLFSVIHDITERKQAEQALKESEERLRLFIEHAPASLAMFDRRMRYLSVSRRWLSDYGLGDRDLRGLSHYEVFPEVSDRWKEVHRRGLAGEVIRVVADRLDRADGTAQWLRWEVRPWLDASGAVAGIVIFTEDITERKKAEEERERLLEEVRRHAGELDAVFKVLPYLVSVHGKDGRYLRVNQAMINLFGFDPTMATREEIARRVQARFPDGRPLTPDNMPSSRALNGETISEVEYVITNDRGEEHVLLVNAIPMKFGDQIYGAVLSQLDITERKKAETALRDSEAQLRTIFEQAAVGIVYAGLDGRFVRFNQRLAEITGYPQEELHQLTFQTITHPDDLEADLLHIRRLLSGEISSFSMDKRYVRKDGSPVWVNLAASLVRDLNGEPGYFIAIIEDIEARKRAQDQIQTQVEELTRLNSAMVGRELRMIELKKEVNELLGRTGRPLRYSLDFEKGQS